MWLLAVALPVQGVSAATMLACGLGHHEHSVSEVSVHSHGHGATHVHVLVASAHDSGVIPSVPPGKTDLGHDHPNAPMTGHGHAAIERHHDGEAVANAHAHEHDTGVAADVSNSHSQHSSHAPGSPHKCSACASCCVGAAVPSQAFSFAAVKLTDSFAPLPARSVAAYVAEGLERPPRAFLA
jgi:hypothetical protein